MNEDSRLLGGEESLAKGKVEIRVQRLLLRCDAVKPWTRGYAGETVRDFHTHTMYSDGFYTPTALMTEAARNGIQEISITDHDTVAGLPDGKRTAESLGIRFLSGVEVTTTWLGKDVHLLGYGLEEERIRGSRLCSYMARIVESDQKWAHRVAEESRREPITLKIDGETERLWISEDELDRFSESSIPSYFIFGVLVKEKLDALSKRFRSVPARHIYYFLFWRSGGQEFIDRYEDLFKDFGIENRTFWNVPRKERPLMRTEELIRMILEVGAVPVLAHPGETVLHEKQIAELALKGLKGVEVYTPKHDAQQTQFYESVASSLGLLRICGTDFHDRYHRNRVEIGKDRNGAGLCRGATLQEISKVRS